MTLAAWRMPLSLERRFVAGAWKGFVRGGATVDSTEFVEAQY
jgi:hypothetical protein